MSLRRFNSRLQTVTSDSSRRTRFHSNLLIDHVQLLKRSTVRLVAVGLFLLFGSTYAYPGQQDAGGERGSPGRAEELMAERRARLARVQPAPESKVK